MVRVPQCVELAGLLAFVSFTIHASVVPQNEPEANTHTPAVAAPPDLQNSTRPCAQHAPARLPLVAVEIVPYNHDEERYYDYNYRNYLTLAQIA